MREWVAGRNPVYEVVRAGRRQLFQLQIALGVQEKGRLAEIMESCTKKRVPVERVPRERLDVLGSGHQGVAVQVSGYPYVDLADILQRADHRGEQAFVLILDTLQDPQNLGTLLRTAEAVGVHGIVLPLRRSATVTPAVVSVSSGASEHLLVAQSNLAQAIERLKAAGLWVIGLEGSDQGELPARVRLDGPVAVVVGNEAEGMRPLVRAACDLLLRLPMRGEIDSLNAAVAGSVALYLVWQAREFLGWRD